MAKQFKNVITSVFLACSMLFSGLGLRICVAADINEYHGNGFTILRILDKSNAIPVSYLLTEGRKKLSKTLPDGMCPSSFSTFLIINKDDIVLVDTGNGVKNGGKTQNILQNAGYHPKDITKIVLTHMHPDHLLGVLEKGGKAFPKATVYIGADEFAFWTSKANKAKAPENQARTFDIAEEFARVYKGSIQLFHAGDTLFSWLASEATPGHTSGHTSFSVKDNSITYLLSGDVIHCLAVQVSDPEVTVPWDTDQKLAAQTRRAMLAKTADSNIIVLGAHFPEPGAIRVHQSQRGDYVYQDVQPKNTRDVKP